MITVAITLIADNDNSYFDKDRGMWFYTTCACIYGEQNG